MGKLQNKIPLVRFPEFKDEWEEKELGEIAVFSKGKGISKKDISENGINLCIRYGELYTKYSEVIDTVFSKTNIGISNLVLSKKNDVIIPSSGETHIDIATASCVSIDDVILGGDLNIIKTKNDGVFLSYYLNSKKKIDIANLSQGSSVIHLYSSSLSLLKLSIPTIPEQKRIAHFFSVLDNKINELKEKKALLEEYKKGIIQKIFTQEIRFKDKNGKEFPEWKEKKLGNIAKITSGGTPNRSRKNYWNGNIPWISTALINFNTIDNAEEFITDEGIANSSAKLFPKGTLLMAMYGQGKTRGKVAILGIEASTNQACCAIITNDEINTNFLFQNLAERYDEIRNLSNEGGQQNLSGGLIKNIPFPFPTLPEQTKIANFLSKIDDKIKTVNEQIKESKEYKKGLLQRMYVV